MKQFLKLATIAIIVLTNTSCNDDNPSKSGYFSPPSWIQGTWKHEVYDVSYQFTSNNFIQKTSPAFDYNEILKDSERQGFKAEVKETSDGSIYNFIIYHGSTITEYNFVKKSDTQIEWTNPTFGFQKPVLFNKQ